MKSSVAATPVRSMGADSSTTAATRAPLVEAPVAAGAEQRDEVAAGRSAERADAVGVESEALHLLRLAQPLDRGATSSMAAGNGFCGASR